MAGVMATIGVVVAAFAFREAVPDAPLVEGRGRAPDFELENVRLGEPGVSLASADGKPVVLNFWASWCVPCRREMPAFQAVHQANKDRVAFLGANHQDQRAPALALLAETGVGYPSGFDPSGAVAVDYGLYGMPSTVFVSSDGPILGRRTGEMSRADLESAITRFFGRDEPRTSGGASNSEVSGGLGEALAKLCTVGGGVEPSEVRPIFFGRAHDALHELARALTDVDRRAAAELLVAKQGVEADLSAAATDTLAARLERLRVAAGRGLERLGVPALGCLGGN